jgi:hypothetical protein
LLVPAIGAASLPESRSVTAENAAVTMAAIAMRADQECRATLRSRTKPLSQNDFAVFRHASLEAALDNGNGFVAPLNYVLVCGHEGANPGTSSRKRRGSFRLHDTIQPQNIQLMIGRMIRACGTDDAAESARVQISTFSDDRLHNKPLPQARRCGRRSELIPPLPIVLKPHLSKLTF